MSIPRRILFLTSNFPRWSGDSTTPFVLHLARDLTSQGWLIDVLAPHAPGAATHEVLHGVSVDRFRYWWPERGQSVCYGGGALVNLRRRRSEAVKIPPLVASETVGAVRKALTGDYGLIHAHWALPQGVVGVMASRAARVPLVLSVHGGDMFDLQGRAMALLKRFALRWADAVTFNSSATERAGYALVPDLQCTRRIPMGVAVNGVDKGTAAVLRRRHRIGDGPLVVFVGRLVDEKGYEDVLRAVALLREQAPDCRAVICGDGQERVQAERLAAELEITDRVTFMGWVDHSQVSAWFHAADVVVLPSRTGPGGWVEAQGLAIIEAMATGAVVVTTPLGGIKDAVCDGETGLLVPERDPAAICRAVLRTQQDETLRRRLAASARNAARERFSCSATTTAFAALYEELMSRSRGTPSRGPVPHAGGPAPPKRSDGGVTEA